MKYQIAFFLTCIIMQTYDARAELREHRVSVEPGLSLPILKSQNETDFALATWNISGRYIYGVSNWIDLNVGFSFSNYQSIADGTSFTVSNYMPIIGARLKMLQGYKITPIVEIGSSYRWSVYTDRVARVAENVRGDDLKDESHGDFVLNFGLIAEYRLIDMFFLGAGIRYDFSTTQSIQRHHVVFPVLISYKFDI